MIDQYKLVAQSKNSTVVARYVPAKSKAGNYQSEADLEKAFIKLLEDQAYEYLPINNEEDLIDNLRRQLSKLNGYEFTDSEWQQFLTSDLINPNEDIKDKTAKIQGDGHFRLLQRDNGQPENIKLIDKTNIHNNSLQVINQYEARGTRTNRYDVTILINGLPLVHIELKRRGVAIKEAFNQINRYRRESFWSGGGLFEYVQLFVISNGTHTKYYSNTTRDQHIRNTQKIKRQSRQKTSHSFEFTNWWADATNARIPDIIDFTKTFFAKHSILNILTKYCIFTSDQLLLVMRPYQIAATERILNKIEITANYKKMGTNKAGGYVWHTTGSGKTLTSFKAAQLATGLSCIDKVLFVVDRKDLDYQTMAEYDKFQKGAANSNTSTAKLRKQLENSEARIIITTIQKLDRFIKHNQEHAIYNQPLVLIFDECHRSQFGEMHKAIRKKFKKYHLFGFTGTPIFAKNASTSGRANLKTTEQVFGKQLHAYTIVDAITDENVLPFRVDYIKTFRQAENIEDSKIQDIDRERVWAAPQRIANIVQYIRKHFDQKTKHQKIYAFNRQTNIEAMAQRKPKAIEARKEEQIAGFNSIFAVSSIEVAKCYYLEFKKQQSKDKSLRSLKIATIFSYNVNEEVSDLESLEDENLENVKGLDAVSRDFLENAINDYNQMFGTNYDTSSEKFQNYYKDVSMRMKNKAIDLLIVVNMFLTGFDATTLNTLWVDKNLRLHGLLQAYSRTNRILNSIKTFGNIVNFRNLEKATNEALSLFGDKDARGIVLLRSFDEYYEGYSDSSGKYIPGYRAMIQELVNNFPVGEEIVGEEKQKDFIRLYGLILKRVNILSSFDDFGGQEILTAREEQDYRSMYLDLYERLLRVEKNDKEDIIDDLVFEMELVKQVDINIDHILQLIRKHRAKNTLDKELPVEVIKAIDSSFSLRNKKELIAQFVAQMSPESAIEDDWQKFVDRSKLKELKDIIAQENLHPDKTHTLMENAFRDGGIQVSGMAFADILPPMSRFEIAKLRAEKKQAVLEKLVAFFDKFFDI